MSKLKKEFLQDYSVDTLRDSGVSNPNRGDLLRYSGSKWVNSQESAFGKDQAYAERIGLENFSGSQFQTYLQTNLVVTDTSGSNRYRVNIDFLWGHNNSSSDIIARLLFNGTTKELRIEPKDTGTDQRIQNNILKKFTNLAPGTYPILLEIRPSSSSRTSRVYEAVIEAWREV
jgi:hypothetical protein